MSSKRRARRQQARSEGMPFVPPPPQLRNQPAAKYAEMTQRDPVRRRMSGQVKPGLPLIITGGSARHKEFQYQFTEPGKFKKPSRAIYDQSENFDIQKTVNIKGTAEKLRYRLPFNFCPDCDRTDIPREKAVWLGIWMIGEQHKEVDLKPDETVVHTKCIDCVKAEASGTATIELATGDDDYDEWRLRQIRANRMERNIISYIRNRLLANDTRIVVSEEERRRLGGKF